MSHPARFSKLDGFNRRTKGNGLAVREVQTAAANLGHEIIDRTVQAFVEWTLKSVTIGVMKFDDAEVACRMV